MYKYRCPYCDNLLEFLIDFYGYGDGDEEEFDEPCGACDKLHYVKLSYYRDSSSMGVDVEISASCELNQEEHDWQPYTEIAPNLIKCRKCKAIQTTDVEQLDFLSISEGFSATGFGM